MSISTTLTWNVTNTTRDLSDGFIDSAVLVLTGIATNTVGGISTTETHSITSNVGFSTVRIGNEIPYGSVTEANVVEWAKTALGIATVTHYETIIPRHLGFKLDPPIVPEPGTTNNHANGTPW